MLQRFDQEWNPDQKAHARCGLVSGLTVPDAEDGTTGRERWAYLLRWSAHPAGYRREVFRRTVFKAMVTNNDDHPATTRCCARPEAGGCLPPMTSSLWR